MSMQIIVEIENTQTKVTNMRKTKKRWKRWEKTYNCKRQTTWIDECKELTNRFSIVIQCFEMIVFDRFENDDIWDIFECEVDNLIAKKKLFATNWRRRDALVWINK